MAQNKNSSNSEGICRKLYKKLTTSHPESVSSHKNKGLTFFSPKMNSNWKEQPRTNNPCPDHSVIDDEKAAKSGSRQEHVMPRRRVGNDASTDAKPSVVVSAAKTKSLKDEGKFSDYIKKVKDRMRSTVSNVGAVKSEARRDSFNDRVLHYIDRAKIKIRTTSTSVGTDKD